MIEGQEKPGAPSRLAGWAIGTLLLPGTVFGIAAVLNELHLVGVTSTSPIWSKVPMIIFASGGLAVLTTPLALGLAWAFRRSLSTPVKAIVWISAFGCVAFILIYVANPFAL